MALALDIGGRVGAGGLVGLDEFCGMMADDEGGLVFYYWNAGIGMDLISSLRDGELW